MLCCELFFWVLLTFFVIVYIFFGLWSKYRVYKGNL